METKTESAYRDFAARWDGSLDHADRLLAEYDGWELLDGATEAHYAENLDPENGVFDEQAAEVLNVLRDLGFEN